MSMLFSYSKTVISTKYQVTLNNALDCQAAIGYPTVLGCTGFQSHLRQVQHQPFLTIWPNLDTTNFLDGFLDLADSNTAAVHADRLLLKVKVKVLACDHFSYLYVDTFIDATMNR